MGAEFTLSYESLQGAPLFICNKKKSMKKIIKKYVTISAVICAAMFGLTALFWDKLGFDYSMLLGYATMILSLGVIFFAVQSYKNSVGKGYISFKQAFKIGLVITLISSAIYCLCWMVIYYNTEPNIMEEYGRYMVEQMKAAGKPAEYIAAKQAENAKFMKLYENPITNFFLVFFVEPFPIGIIISLIAALLLRSKDKPKAEYSFNQ